MGQEVLRGVDIVKLPQWHYISGYSIAADGTSQAVVLPSDASIVELRASGGDIYFTINHTGFASATAPGFVPENGGEILGPIFNMTALDVYGAVGATAHIMFFKEIAK